MTINFTINFTQGYWLIPLLACCTLMVFYYFQMRNDNFDDKFQCLYVIIFLTVFCLLTRFLP